MTNFKPSPEWDLTRDCDRLEHSGQSARGSVGRSGHMKTKSGRPVRYSIKRRPVGVETLHRFQIGDDPADRVEHGVRRLRELTLDLRQMLGIEAARD